MKTTRLEVLKAPGLREGTAEGQGHPQHGRF
jgi:hypothetical protein